MKVKLDDKGRMIIPKFIREALGISSEIELKLEEDKLILTKPKNK